LGLLADSQWKIVVVLSMVPASHIQFKLGTAIDHTFTQVASRGMTPRSKGQRSRSQRHVTYSVKIAITQHGLRGGDH